MSVSERVMLELLCRVYWRDGDLRERLWKTEQRARVRARGDAYSSDQDLDLSVATLARRMRIALLSERRAALARPQEAV